jgi:hypothetical protein
MMKLRIRKTVLINEEDQLTSHIRREFLTITSDLHWFVLIERIAKM